MMHGMGWHTWVAVETMTLSSGQSLALSLRAACYQGSASLWVSRIPDLRDRSSRRFSLSPFTTEGSSAAKEAFGRATDSLGSLWSFLSHSCSPLFCVHPPGCVVTSVGAGSCLPSVCLSFLIVNG